MFTGLVQEKARIAQLDKVGSNLHIKIQSQKIIQDLALGDSVSVDGVCQTLVNIESDCFEVIAIPETLKVTNFGQYQIGHKVNLEACLRLGDKIGGHIVQGHVDACSRVFAVNDLDASRELFLTVPANLLKYIIHKGSICVNGVSLTVAALDIDKIKLCIIPQTLKETNLSDLKQGDLVNIEVDCFAKYIENFAYDKISNQHS